MSDWTQLGDGVWTRNYTSLDLNVGVVAGDNALLIVDTRADVIQGRELREDLRHLSPLPVGWVVNTHYHWDHTWGNQMFAGAAIWGHVRCAEEMRQRGEAHRKLLMEEIPEYTDRFAAVAITPPERTFADSADIDVGPRTVELRHLGRGHTDSDIVVRVGGVVFGGDLIENGAPPSFGDSFPLDWPGAVAALLGLGDDVFVPGHGEVADRAFVATQHEQFAALARLATEHHAAGLDPEQAAAAGAPFPTTAAVRAFARAFRQLDGGE